MRDLFIELVLPFALGIAFGHWLTWIWAERKARETTMPIMDDYIYPCAIVRDRYGGAFSGAVWLAFPFDWWDIPDEVEGGDNECMFFWETYGKESWQKVGKGGTPQAAYDELYKQLREATNDH